MHHFIALSELLDHCGRLQADEAVAVILRLFDFFRAHGDVDPAAPGDAPALENVLLDSEGAIVCRATATMPAVADIGRLLEALVTRGCAAPIPGALRYTIARALFDVDAPPFGTVDELATALRRFEKRERGVVLRALYQRASSRSPGGAVRLGRDAGASRPQRPERRRNMPSATDLRRQLREADRELYELLVASSRDRMPVSRARGLPVATVWTLAVTGFTAAFGMALFLLTAGVKPAPADDRSTPPFQAQRPAGNAASADSPGTTDALQRAAPPRAPRTEATLMRDDAASTLTRPVPGPAFSPWFASDGEALFFHTGRNADTRSALMAAANGSAVVPIVDDGARNFHVRPSPDGRHIAFDSDREGERAVYVADRDGSHRQRVTVDGFAAVPTWSPDSRRLTFVRAEPADRRVWNLWMLTLDTGEIRRLTQSRFGQTWGASWFPDARRIGYSHEDRFIVLDVDTKRSQVYRSPVPGRLVRTPAVSPDGTHVIFQVRNSGAWLLDLPGGSMRRVLSDRSAEEFAWSPDGGRVAFHSRRAGDWGIWILDL